MSAVLFKKADASDYITYKKRNTIAKEYANALNTNPVKTNGLQYNQNFTFLPSTVVNDLSNCLIHAQSFELKLDYTSGLKGGCSAH
jgi:hypothetical protein